MGAPHWILATRLCPLSLYVPHAPLPFIRLDDYSYPERLSAVKATGKLTRAQQAALRSITTDVDSASKAFVGNLTR